MKSNDTFSILNLSLQHEPSSHLTLDTSTQYLKTLPVQKLNLSIDRKRHRPSSTKIFPSDSSTRELTTLARRAPITLVDLGNCPVNLFCSECQKEITTLVYEKSGKAAWKSFLVCIMCFCWCGCCLIPFYNQIFKEYRHTCPDCKTLLGTQMPVSNNPLTFWVRNCCLIDCFKYII